MRPSRRFHLVLQADLDDQLRRNASIRGTSLAEALRHLAAQGLAMDSGEGASDRVETPGTLAALVAAELAVLMVASVLPEGEQRMRSLAERAAVAAAERLALIKESGP